MRFYDVPVNQSVPTEANRGLISYTQGMVAENPNLSPDERLGIIAKAEAGVSVAELVDEF
jgi:hypothetical protein